MWSVLGILWGILAFFGIGVFIALFMGAGLGSSEHQRKQNARSEAIYGVKYVPPSSAPTSSALTDKWPLSALELEFETEIGKMIARQHRPLQRSGLTDGLGHFTENRMSTYNVFLDGKAWCATGDGFVNLQESLAGFGDSPVAALGCLIVEEKETEIKRRESIRHWVCGCCTTEFDLRYPGDDAPCPYCKAGGQYTREMKPNTKQAS